MTFQVFSLKLFAGVNYDILSTFTRIYGRGLFLTFEILSFKFLAGLTVTF